MNILIAFNSSYYMAARVLMHSILVHNECEVIVYVMYSSLTQVEMDTLQEDARNSGHARVVYIPIEQNQFSDAPLHCKWISKETYYRLLAQELMPADVERFLYLDVDMVVMKSLEELYNMDFEGKLMVACNSKGRGEIPARTLEQLTLPPDTIYFNAGTLLYNLKEQRETIDPHILHEYPILFYKHLKYGDQDVLNAVFYDQVKYADYHIYNMFDCKIDSEEDRIQADETAAIFHFNGCDKPWRENYWGRCSDMFWRYACDFPEYALMYTEEFRKKQKESFIKHMESSENEKKTKEIKEKEAVKCK